jgi:ankyrin repeat protein
MHASASNPNPEVISLLIKAGADVNGTDIVGMSALLMAAMNNANPEVVKRLLQAGADPNAMDKRELTPLLTAAWFNGNPKVASVFIEGGARIDERRRFTGMTPLMHAARYGRNPDVVIALLDHGADASLKDRHGKSALTYAQANKHLVGTAALRRLTEADQ